MKIIVSKKNRFNRRNFYSNILKFFTYERRIKYSNANFSIPWHVMCNFILYKNEIARSSWSYRSFFAVHSHDVQRDRRIAMKHSLSRTNNGTDNWQITYLVAIWCADAMSRDINELSRLTQWEYDKINGENWFSARTSEGECGYFDHEIPITTLQ